MPVLNVKLSGVPVHLDRQTLARQLTALTEQTLRKRAEVTAVVIEEISPELWFVGGESLRQPVAQLDIRVTEGTNSEAEKAEFVVGAFNLLSQYLRGRLHPVSYVSINSCPASDWGYEGKTQAARRAVTEGLLAA